MSSNTTKYAHCRMHVLGWSFYSCDSVMQSKDFSYYQALASFNRDSVCATFRHHHVCKSFWLKRPNTQEGRLLCTLEWRRCQSLVVQLLLWQVVLALCNFLVARWQIVVRLGEAVLSQVLIELFIVFLLWILRNVVCRLVGLLLRM